MFLPVVSLQAVMNPAGSLVAAVPPIRRLPKLPKVPKRRSPDTNRPPTLSGWLFARLQKALLASAGPPLPNQLSSHHLAARPSAWAAVVVLPPPRLPQLPPVR